jgi:hypothetical protein
MSHYCFHHHYNRRTVLKKNVNKEYQQLVYEYGKENVELEKETLFAYWYKCWINEADGELVYDPLIDKYVFILDAEERDI